MTWYELNPDPDDRPTRAELEAEAADEEALRRDEEAEAAEQWGPDYEERTCIICDGVGHAYIIGWHEVPGKGTQPITAGGPCPLEEQGRDTWDDDEPF